MVRILGLAAISIVGTNPAYFEGGVVGGKIIGGGNTPVMHLHMALGGNLSSASCLPLPLPRFSLSCRPCAGRRPAIAHDPYARIIRRAVPWRTRKCVTSL